MLLWSLGQDFMASDCSGLLRRIMSASCRLTTQAEHVNPPQLLKPDVSGLRENPGRAQPTALNTLAFHEARRTVGMQKKAKNNRPVKETTELIKLYSYIVETVDLEICVPIQRSRLLWKSSLVLCGFVYFFESFVIAFDEVKIKEGTKHVVK